MDQNPNPVVDLLLKSPLTPTQRRAASEAFSAAVDEDDLVSKIEGLQLPKSVMADLWDLKVAQGPQLTGEVAGPEGSALGRFASNLGEQINPVTIAKGLYNTVRHPLDTAGNIIAASGEQVTKAIDAADRGDYLEVPPRLVAASVPILGPAAAEAGEQIASGDVAGGLGKAVGIVGPMLAIGAVRRSPSKQAVKADALEREAVQQVSDRVLAPKNPKYKSAAQEVSPELLKRGVQGDRIAVQQWADDLITDAQMRIDDAIAKYPATDRLPTTGVMQTLSDAMDQLSFDGPSGPRVNPAFQKLYGQLAEWRTFVKDRGPDMSFADMRRLRQQLDKASSEAGAFAKAKGDTGLSAVEEATLDTANAIRKQIAESRPELAGPNADMHLGITVRDILNPVKGRPAQPPSATTGATGGLHTTGAIIGAATNIPIVRPIAAFVASEVIPRLREYKVSPQNQLRLAKDKYDLAQALKAGKPSLAQRALRNMSMYVPSLSSIGRITEPSGASK